MLQENYTESTVLFNYLRRIYWVQLDSIIGSPNSVIQQAYRFIQHDRLMKPRSSKSPDFRDICSCMTRFIATHYQTTSISKSIVMILNTIKELAMKKALIFQQLKQMKNRKMDARTAVPWQGEECNLVQDGQPKGFKGKSKYNWNQQNIGTHCFRTSAAGRRHQREQLVTVTWSQKMNAHNKNRSQCPSRKSREQHPQSSSSKS